MADGSPTIGLIDNPLAGEAMPQPEQEAAAAPPAPAPADKSGTALLAVGALDLGCSLFFDAPLTPDEERMLNAALLPVLHKRGIPNLPFAEELQLAGAVGVVVLTRIKAKAAQERAAQEAQSTPNDTPQRGPEGLRQIDSPPGAGGAMLGAAGAEASDLVS